MSTIAIDNLVVRYRGAATTALGGVTLSAVGGSLTAVVGPNGSGKSTLVRALVGRVPIETGDVLIDGVSMRALSRRAVAQRVAVVTQREEPAFPLTGREYVALGRYPHGSVFRAASIEDSAIDVAADRASVTALLSRRTDELSGGEWQRLRIARALAQGGDAMVLDEPTTFLDIGHEMAFFELLASLAHAGMAVLLISHQLNLVARFADRVVLLHQGRVVADGSPDAVMQGPVLEQVYDWPLVIARDPAVGAPMLIPLRPGG